MPIEKVVVCDDGEGTRIAFVHAINKALGREVAKNIPDKELKATIHGIMANESGGEFDGADVVVIDNRLIDDWTDERDPKVSAEQLSDEVRTRSSAKAVVILNDLREIDFDLRLDGRVYSYADLNITERCLGVLGLWTEQPPEGFRPWAWPVLDQLIEKLEQRCIWLVDGHLDDPVLASFSLSDDSVARALSRSALDFLHPSLAPRDVTFRAFVEGATRSTDQKAREKIAHDDRLAAKIAASRLGKWLDRIVLGPQDVLVDVPHLLGRYSCLLPKPSDVRSWDSAISWSELRGFDYGRVAAHEWPHWNLWLSRPAYYWAHIQDDDDLRSELLKSIDDQSNIPAEVVFCEDFSRFVPVDHAREFVADFDSVFDRRWALRSPPGGFSYGPASRFAR